MPFNVNAFTHMLFGILFVNTVFILFKDKSEDEVYIPSATPNVPTPGPDEPEDAFRNVHRN